MIKPVAAVALALGVVACMPRGADRPEEAGVPVTQREAAVDLRDASGQTKGSARLSQEAGGVRVRLTASQMAAGTYGAHVHGVGRCDAPDFTTAGGHWNPTGAQHGRENPAGAHRGDLPNLTVSANGRGTVQFLIAGATIGGNADSMLDADGAALLIHAAADDYRTDPSGNSGARIACGLVGAAR